MQKATKKAVIVTNVGVDVLNMLDEEAKKVDSPRSYIIRKIIREYFDQKQKREEGVQ